MSTTTTTIDLPDDLVTLKAAARDRRCRVARVKELVEAGKLLAYRRGGTDRHPRLVVSLARVRAVMLAESVYVPRRAAAPVPGGPRTSLNPAAAKMLAAAKRRRMAGRSC